MPGTNKSKASPKVSNGKSAFARRSRKDWRQRALHDAGANRIHLTGGTVQGDHWLRTVQVRKGRLEAGRASRILKERRLYPARRGAERINRWQEGLSVIWRYTADPWDAAEDLAAGEVDWWQEPPLDFIPKIEQNPDLRTFLIDPLGQQGWLRPNFLHPPFNNKKARQALLHAIDQVTFLYLSLGQSKYYRSCNSVFACGGPYATTIGAEAIVEHSQTKAIQLLKESGYDGTPVVVFQITDRPFLNAAAVVTRQRLESVGFRVILKAMDWSTNLIVGAGKTPPDKGGWNVLFTWFHGADVINPAVHFGLSGAGPRASRPKDNGRYSARKAEPSLT